MGTVFEAPRTARWKLFATPIPRRSSSAPDPRVTAGLARKIVGDRLRAIDAEVKAHEAAHSAALGAGSGIITYTTIIGPDGNAYAVGGSIPVSLRAVPGDPEATIRKAKAIIQAAYAVGQPSAADMRVAAEAYQLEMSAQRELAARQDNGDQGPPGMWSPANGTAARHEWWA